MKSTLCLLLFVALFGRQAWGQGTPNPYDPAAKVLPPSPEAASMQRFGATPVNLFKGEPTISVPIYNFKLRNLEVPVSLSYNAGGFKVGELATAVGLGWSLQCGGMINVSVNGQNDLKEGVRRMPADVRTFSPTVYGSADYIMAKTIVEEKYDTEPDVFNYTYPGGSGKFIFDDSLATIYTIPFSNVKIEKISDGFKIINESGVQYYYTTTEKNNVTEFCTLGSPNKRDMSGQIGTGWFLSQIIAASAADTITFEYEDYHYAYREGRNETRFKYLPSSACGSQAATFTNQERECTRMMRYNTNRIKKVKATGNGEIEFYYTNTRADIDSSYLNANAKSLDSIVIRNSGNTTVKSYALQYSYFLSGDTSTVTAEDRPLYRRLKLQSIQESGTEPYVFKYQESHKLPFRLSSAQDLLGYNSNGVNSNGSMIPCIDGGNNYEYCSLRDISPFFNQDAFVLNKIIYPTGGSSNFLYEQHTSTSTVMVYDTTYSSFGIEAEPEEIVMDSVSATSTYLYLNINWNLPCEDDRELGCSNGYVKLPDGGKLQLDSIGETGNITVTFQPGKYISRIGSFHQFADFAYITMNWIDTVIGHLDTIPKLHSGIRLKQMVDSAGFNSPPIIKEYSYPDINDRRFVSYSEQVSTRQCNNDNPYYCDFLRYNGMSVSPFGINTDFDFGYSTVTVDQKSLAEQPLREKYYFYASTGGIDSVGEYNELVHYGRQKKKETFRYSTAESSYKKQMEEENFYTMRVDEEEFWNSQEQNSHHTHQKFFPGLKVSYVFPEQTCDVFQYAAEFSVEPYIKSTFWEYLNKTSSKQFGKIGDSLMTVKKFFYDSSVLNLPTRTEEINSKAQTVKTILKYPHNFPTTSPYDEMISRNIIMPVVEQIQTNTTVSKELSKTKINFKFWNSNAFILPDTLKSSTGGNALITEATINDYDSKGNLLQTTTKGGLITSFIWGYNQQYPVAKILGKSYANAVSQSGVSLSVLENPSDDNAMRTELNKLRTLTSVIVNTYTYKPLVGVTSETDARGTTVYYEYDSAARLKLIKDQDGKVLKIFDYKYQVTNQQ